ncbi:MAG: AAA domain-containing protein, partial [Nanoarchaeota archaeon]|nr:AAA domain-containing protein [Nanoarchaeota archaeon]
MSSLTFNFMSDGKRFHSNIFKNEQFFSHKKEQIIIKKTPEIEDIFKNYKLLQRELPVFYGYPLFMDSNGNISPVFFVEIFFEEKDDSIIFTKESVIPEFNHYILTKHYYSVEEINKTRLEIEEEENFSLKLQKITELLSLDKKVLSSELEQKSLILKSSSQLINKAILYFGGKMGFTKGLVDELQKLKKLSQHQLESTSLGILFNKEKNEILKNKKDILEIFNLNESQEEAVKNAFSSDISVITGPPGTGKSQVVLNMIANAVWNDKTVLFASKNNRAVDVVNEKLKTILSKDLIVRMGSSKHRKNAKLQIHKLFQNKNSLNISIEIIKYKQLLQDNCYKISEKYTEINKLSDLNEDIESIYRRIDGLTNIVPKELHRNFQKDRYQFLINCDIEKDIKNCEKISSKLKEITFLKKQFSDKLISLRKNYKKPKIIFTLLKEINSISESKISKDLQIITKIESKREKLQNELKDIKKEKEDIIKDKKYKEVYGLLNRYDSNS